MTDIPEIFCKITIIVMNTETSGKLNILIMFGKLHYTYYYSVSINCTLIVESLRIRAEVIYEWDVICVWRNFLGEQAVL